MSRTVMSHRLPAESRVEAAKRQAADDDSPRGRAGGAKTDAKPTPPPADARRRVWVERIAPEIDGGRWPAKGIVGEPFTVEADLVSDGHDVVGGALLYRYADSQAWENAPLRPVNNDRFVASFELARIGMWEYTVEGWIDEYATWQRMLRRRVEARQDVDLELQVGAEILSRAAKRASGNDSRRLQAAANTLRSKQTKAHARARTALGARLAELAAAYPDRELATHERVLRVRADRDKAQFSTWYELFPRSTGPDGQHGTFRTVEQVLPYVAAMGFDVLYLPPIHPIGRSHRKGRNNSLEAGKGEPGSPWAIGSAEGGHKAVHPELGTLADFRHLLAAAGNHGLEVALDIALQASPDHPYVTEHPEWFQQRPDGTIRYAENPPKKYQDIYPFDFACEQWRSLWREMHSIFVFWIEQGVRLFRVDNPHTKPLEFWAWCIGEIQKRYPDVLFLAEAFTRPKLMYALAKAGFAQSYTYFTWRNTSREFRDYIEELTNTEVKHFFRPNFWPNTPDILPEHLQWGGRSAFVARLVLASTLSSNYGIYGPAFELMERVARPESEEYVDNEKYEIKDWQLDDPESLRPLVARINRARRDHPALQQNHNLCFHPTDNDQLLCYSKYRDDPQDRILVVVNLDFHHTQSGCVELNLEALDIGSGDTFQVHDLLSGARYLWHGPRNYVELNPGVLPAHVFAIRRFVRRETDFDYYA